MENIIKIGIIQMRSERGDIENNISRAKQYIYKCITDGADLICLTELFNTGYYWDPEIKKVIKQSFNTTCNLLKNIAVENNVTIVGGIGENDDDLYYDSMFIVKNNGESYLYRKTHLFRDEEKYFEEGNETLVTDIKGIKVGFLNCVEVCFPEFARTLALDGAELLVCSMAFGSARGKIYDLATRSRAIENNCYLISSNQTGKSKTGNDDHDFYGHSRVVTPLGDVVDMGQKEAYKVVKIDLDLIKLSREGKLNEVHPYFRMRRPELYKN